MRVRWPPTIGTSYSSRPSACPRSTSRATASRPDDRVDDRHRRAPIAARSLTLVEHGGDAGAVRVGGHERRQDRLAAATTTCARARRAGSDRAVVARAGVPVAAAEHLGDQPDVAPSPARRVRAQVRQRSSLELSACGRGPWRPLRRPSGPVGHALSESGYFYHGERAAPAFLALPERATQARRSGLTHVLDKGLPVGDAERVLAVRRPLHRHLEARLGHRLPRSRPAGQARPARRRRRAGLHRRHAAGDRLAAGRGRAVPRLGRARPASRASRSPAAWCRMPRGRRSASSIARAAERFVVLCEVGTKDPQAAAVTAAVGARGRRRPRGRRHLGGHRGPGERHRRAVPHPDGQGARGASSTRCVGRSAPTGVVFEAPRKDQQAWLIRRFGPDVNLGNIALGEVLGAGGAAARAARRHRRPDRRQVAGVTEPGRRTPDRRPGRATAGSRSPRSTCPLDDGAAARRCFTRARSTGAPGTSWSATAAPPRSLEVAARRPRRAAVLRRRRRRSCWPAPDDSALPASAPTSTPRVPRALVAARPDAPARACVVVEGRYGHVSFVLDPTPLRLHVLDVAPPWPAKLVDQVERVLDTAEDLPPIELVPTSSSSPTCCRTRRRRHLPAAVPRRRRRGAGRRRVAYLDEVPPRRDWTLLGCARSQQIHDVLLRRAASHRSTPARVRWPRVDVPPARSLLTKCCLLEEHVETEDGRSSSRGARRFAQLREALEAAGRRATWEPP